MKKQCMRRISWILVVLMAVLALSGCAAEDPGNNGSTAPDSQVEQPAEAAADSPEQDVDDNGQDGDPEESASGSETQTEAAASEGSDTRPAMWQVTDPQSGNVLYLFGSIHAAQEDLYPLNREIMDIFEACDALAVEVDVQVYTEDLTKAMEMAQYMVYTDGASITDDIDEELFQRVLDVMEAEGIDLGVPAEAAAMFRPYTFISLLSNLGVEKSGLSAELGVDLHLLQLAKAKEMEVREVETMESQLLMFNEFSPGLTAYLLEEALDADAAGEGVRELYENWKAGDVEALAESGEAGDADQEELRLLEEYNTALLTDRNEWMTDVAEEYLEEGAKVFYVVGALHMVGEDGIVQQLIDRGYDVERIAQ